MAELLVRAAWGDHLVVSDLLATGGGIRLATARRFPISQLVADAHVAEGWPVLSELAQSAGIPYIVDPMTPLAQSGAAPDDRWAQLPFGRSEPVEAADLDLPRLVADVIEFQLDKGATTIVPPYFYASSPSDPWFAASLEAIERAAEYMERGEIRLQLMPIFCAKLLSFGNSATWTQGIDRFVAFVASSGSAMALCMSPAGDAADGYGKVRRLFDTAIRAKASGLHVIAWRQGVYGPGLVAAGLDGYECGMGIGERSDIANQQARRKRHNTDSKPQGGGGAGIFIETLGRSVPRRVGQTLFGETAMRPKVMCDDESCCPSVAETLDKPRHHAVRTRSRLLAALSSQPNRAWRLNHLARNAASAATIANQANSVLQRARLKERIKLRHLESIEQVAHDLAAGAADSRSA